MSYQRKTTDEYRLYVNYGYGHGFEHECTYDTLAELRQGLKEYRENTPYPVKGKKVRVKDAVRAIFDLIESYPVSIDRGLCSRTTNQFSFIFEGDDDQKDVKLEQKLWNMLEDLSSSDVKRFCLEYYGK